MKAIKLFFLFLFCINNTWAQESFEAVCNEQEVVVGVPFEVSFQLKNASIKRLDPPKFAGFETRGPNVSQSYSYVNGSSSSNEAHTYYLVANKVGSYKIGSAKVLTSQGKTLVSNPISIKIVERKSASNNINSANDISSKVFLVTELSTNDAVVGEQVTIDIRIYTKIGIEQTELVKEPQFENVYSHHLHNFNDRTKVVVVRGEQYLTQILRRIIIFPSRPGKIDIDPVVLKIGVSSTQGAGMFNPFVIIPYTLYSEAVVLNVRELSGAVNGFSGAVGNYNMQAHVEKNNIESDDVVELTVRVQGYGDIKQVLAPNLNTNKKYFDQFEPNIQENSHEGSGLLGGVKEFQYVLTPKATGDFIINPSFVFYDTDKKRFVTIDTLISIQVNQGKNKLPTKAERDSMKDKPIVIQEEKTLLEFKQPETSASFVAVQKGFFLGSIPFLLLTSFPFLALFIFFVWKGKQEVLDNIPEADKKRNKAVSEATLRLQNAQLALSQKNSTIFYNEISKALLGFVADKYSIPTVELTKDNVRQKLSEQAVPNNKIDSLVSIIQTCEMAIFAGLKKNDSMEKVYQDSVVLIQEI